MEYRGSPDAAPIATDETNEQTKREQVFPAVVYGNESEVPESANESNVQIARLDEDDVRLIPLYKDEAQTSIPSHQYLQHHQQEPQNSARISNPGTPVVAPALPTNGNLGYGFPAQPPVPSNGFPGANPSNAPGLNFNVNMLAQTLAQNAALGNQGGFIPQSPFNQVGYNAAQGYNPQLGYGQQPYNGQPVYNGQPAYHQQPYNGQQPYNTSGFNMQQNFRPDPVYNAPQPAYSPPGGQRRAPPIHPDRLHPDRRDADRQGGNYRRRGA